MEYGQFIDGFVKGSEFLFTFTQFFFGQLTLSNVLNGSFKVYSFTLIVLDCPGVH